MHRASHFVRESRLVAKWVANDFFKKIKINPSSWQRKKKPSWGQHENLWFVFSFVMARFIRGNHSVNWMLWNSSYSARQMCCVPLPVSGNSFEKSLLCSTTVAGAKIKLAPQTLQGRAVGFETALQHQGKQAEMRGPYSVTFKELRQVFKPHSKMVKPSLGPPCFSARATWRRVDFPSQNSPSSSENFPPS